MSRTAIILLCATTWVGACKKAEEPTTPPVTTEPAAPAAATTEEEAGQAGVVVDDAVVKLCDLPEARFDFDSAKLSPSATTMLDALAVCFISGPGKDEGMRLVGHADPRGTEDYNMGLGQRRAGSVSEYLLKKGLPEDRMETSSRGELDATGTEDTGWARDRRVDILLAK
jgi:peptidoglycan-associated lipoprotein